MEKFFLALIQKTNKIASLPVLVLSLCSVIICGMMYIKMEENHRLYLELLSQNGMTAIQPSDTPLSSTLHAGDTVTIRISAKQVEDLYGYQFKLNYDESAMQYKSLRSSIDEITTIFQKPFDGYLLVGATMVGESEGFNGQEAPVCEIVMSVTKDGPVPGVSISEVNLVDSSLNYDEGITDWVYEILPDTNLQ